MQHDTSTRINQYSLSSTKKVFNMTERADRITSLSQINMAGYWADEINIWDMFWQPVKSAAFSASTKHIDRRVRKLTLRGNDVLAILPFLIFPGLESLTLILTEQSVTLRTSKTPAGSASINHRAVSNYYSLLTGFMKRCNTALGRPLKYVTIHDPLISDDDLAHLLSFDLMRSIPRLTITGVPNILDRFTRFLTLRADAYKLLGSNTVIDRSAYVWFVKRDATDNLYDSAIHEAYIGWVERWDKDLQKVLVEYRGGEARWANGRYHRLVGSCH